MLKRNIKVCLALSFILLGVLFSAYLADALGVALDYWPQNGDTEANPLTVYPGDNQLINIRLQNTDPEDLQAKVILKDGAGIASVQERVYAVPGGTTNTEVPIGVSIPEDAEIGSKYMILVSVDSVVDSQGEGVSFGVGYEVKIPVEVVERPIPLSSPVFTSTSITLYITSAILIIVVIVLFVLRKKKTK